MFLGSAVVYSNAAKVGILGVPEETIGRHGAVSQETAAAMADGARKVFGSDISVAVTGIAGPGGAVPGKPVGTVYIACSHNGGCACTLHRFHGSRQSIRDQTVEQ